MILRSVFRINPPVNENAELCLSEPWFDHILLGSSHLVISQQSAPTDLMISSHSTAFKIFSAFVHPIPRFASENSPKNAVTGRVEFFLQG